MKKQNDFIEKLFIVLGKKSIKHYHGKDKKELMKTKKEFDNKLSYLAALTNYEKACQDSCPNFKLGFIEKQRLNSLNYAI